MVDLETAAFSRLVVPYARNMNFVGRETILQQVGSLLEMPKSNNRVALYGLGGVGKSQVALELAYRAHTTTPGLCCLWVSAVSRTTFAQSYREIASSLGIPGVNNPQADGLDLVKSWLQRETAVPWLMIVDNVDDLRTLKGETSQVDMASFNLLKYLPQCDHGKLLFTSRSRTAALRITGGGMVVKLPLMDVSEAQQLLQVRLDEDNSQASQDYLELVKALEYLPLAISHAASYIREMSITPARYLRLFNDDKKMARLLKHTYEDLARDGGQSNTVITTWRISFEQIQKDSPESAELLKIMGSLHWQSIPQYLLQQDQWEDEDDFHDAVAPLLAFSLVQSSAELEMFSMHRLIQIAIRSWTRTMEWERTAQRLLLQVFPRLEVHISISAEEDIVRCRQLLPHAQKVLEILGSPDMFSVPCVELKFRTAACLKILGQYQQARALYETLITPLVDFSERHVSTGFSLANVEDEITRLYLLEGGNYNIAVQRARLALKSRKEFLLESDPDIVCAKNLLALGLIELAQFKDAEAQLKSAYTAAVESLGKTHNMTIAVLLSLTAVYKGQEQYQRAAETYQSVMDLLIPLHGENNDLIIECRAGMAEVQRCMLRTPEAGVLIRQALARSEEKLGPDHPVTTLALTRLGCQRMDEGDKPGAYVAFERAWRNHRNMYGDESRLTLGCLGRMAVGHASLTEAERLLKEAIERSKRIWGPLEKTTLGLEDDLFFVLFRKTLGSSKQATEAYARSTLEARTNSLGEDAKSTLRAAQNVAFVLLAQNKVDEGQKLCLSTLNKQTKVLGSDSRDARVSSELLSSAYQLQRDFYASEVVLHRLIRVLERIAGPDHSSTLNQKSRLGSVIVMAYSNKKSNANVSRTFALSYPQCSSTRSNSFFHLMRHVA
ncbi:P-loop containing nucleoside triphosphate hydrolase protein [Amylocarpus encephaloides]|uniref:P-loop containing nucleoside triphosphate hydrolase protein n=1 Tax=Amylocarpus encephaloides TaxID=45428 RepID=A0A9P8C1Z1_9HELO|nr:P-loop containing nucleoside triphosphate hydrolase protein [Amylocarpus encephaloides]